MLKTLKSFVMNWKTITIVVNPSYLMILNVTVILHFLHLQLYPKLQVINIQTIITVTTTILILNNHNLKTTMDMDADSNRCLLRSHSSFQLQLHYPNLQFHLWITVVVDVSVQFLIHIMDLKCAVLVYSVTIELRRDALIVDWSSSWKRSSFYLVNLSLLFFSIETLPSMKPRLPFNVRPNWSYAMDIIMCFVPIKIWSMLLAQKAIAHTKCLMVFVIVSELNFSYIYLLVCLIQWIQCANIVLLLNNKVIMCFWMLWIQASWF